MYPITKYSFDRAKKLGVTIKPSTLKNKKIDIYKDGKKIASVGGVKIQYLHKTFSFIYSLYLDILFITLLML